MLKQEDDSTCISPQRFTDQGIKGITTMPQRGAETAKRLESIGINLTGYYLVMGEYDEVVIWEAPSDEADMIGLLELGARENWRTTTLKAFTREESVEIIKKLPWPGRRR
jgi:uncharacterized protein with GYD domain